MAGADGTSLATQLQNSLKITDSGDQLVALEQRQLAIIKRIEDLELRLSSPPSFGGAAILSQNNKSNGTQDRSGGINNSPSSAPSSSSAPPLPPKSTLPISSPVQIRLEQELIQKGFTNHLFIRAPPEYYDRPLEFRQGIVGAASVHHMCKSIVMENTRVEADNSDPSILKYWLVIVQYTAKLHSDKLRAFVQKAHDGKLSKKQINMRLCPEDVSNDLTGFEHNGVSPIAIKTRLPIILSHKIAALEPDVFWLGAGEVDLKVGMSAADFVRGYEPHVVDCTYDD
jgi:prolyl-tRNA editing enzyme YbaK/EbsC (Cys-tRNA(Pro) deacylase)